MVSDTTDKFNLLDAGTKTWYSDMGKKFVYSVSMEDNDNCKTLMSKSVTNETCSVIQRPGSLPLYLVQTKEFKPGEDSNVALTHGVFMSRDGKNEDGSEVVFFTGRSWVMTTERRLLIYRERQGGDNTFSNVTDVLAFFATLDLSQVRWGSLWDPPWVKLISEAFDPKDLQYLPQITDKWYYPKNTTSGTLPSPDESRPVESFSCIDCMINPDCNTGNCNQITSQCECLHNETGPFCEYPPTRNGVCDDFFNKNETYFDGGDCCAPSCWSPYCGKDGLRTLFGIGLSQEGSTFASTNSSEDELIGFQKCQDEESFRTILLEIVQVRNATEVCVPPFTVQCEGRASPDLNIWYPGATYLRTPLLCTSNVTSLKEEIMTPPGVNCNLTMDTTTTEASGIEKLCVRMTEEETCLVEASSGTLDQGLEWTVPCGSDC